AHPMRIISTILACDTSALFLLYMSFHTCDFGLHKIFAAFRNPVALETGAGEATVVLNGLVPFTDVADVELRASVFEFVKMVVRQRNGHLSVRRDFNASTLEERWTIKDEGRWLW
ncbi:MAG: hypothetical protein VXW58_13290, partial [Pseudomonadota bacterium]|nr:hypothetical protein [Pseudomonadota bacterium]